MCTYVGCGREGREGDRDTGDIFCPRHWLDKCLQEGVFRSGRVPGQSPVWVEALPPGLSVSEGERQIHSHLHEFYSHLLLLKSRRSPLVLDSKRETRAVLLPLLLEWFTATSQGSCEALAAQADGNRTQLTIPLQSCF